MKKGTHHTEETKNKISASETGKIITKKQRKNMTAALYRRWENYRKAKENEQREEQESMEDKKK